MLKKISHFLFKKHLSKTLFVGVLVLAWYWWILPKPLFSDPTCMVLEDSKGDLLGARIASDGQWRFPYQKDIPEKFKAAIIEFEDRRFMQHWGIDPRGIGRAIQQNVKHQKVVSGGSTISMQVIRMARNSQSRNLGRKRRSLYQKLIEAILATRLECSYSKEEILALYASNAPFGGNVVGLDAASWRYYAKSPHLLSWGEVATLAVLPNAPALIHPGRNRAALLAKRNRLIDRLAVKGVLDATSADLAKEEPLPDKPHPLPRLAPHLLDRAYLEHFKNNKNSLTRLRSTLNRRIQQQVNQIVKKQHSILQQNAINNLAAIVIEVETGKVLAYVGNEISAGLEHGQSVDVMTAPRSTGSILKPFLMAFALQDGSILPNSMLSDVPTQMSGYRPKNYYETYDGVVSLQRALSRSLNVPFIRLLSKYGLEKFHQDLQNLGLTGINQSANHYGLPLVLGGAEASLWDISKAYLGMSRTLQHYVANDSQYDKSDFDQIHYQAVELGNTHTEYQEEAPLLSASAIWHTFEAMKALERPSSEGNWQEFQSSKQIAWKTGTSFGFRDAWAVGVTPQYVVGVWVGNADGEGRPGLVGVEAAAPVLFDIFDLLPQNTWFTPPYDDMVEAAVCHQSGYRALSICEVDSLWIPLSGLKAAACKHHQILHLDAEKQYQVNASCLSPDEMNHQAWYVLPPIEAHYYSIKNPAYQAPPPFGENCRLNPDATINAMQLIYPKQTTKIYVPTDLDGNRSRTVFKVAHRDVDALIHWHLNESYLGHTRNFHEMELNPPDGVHNLVLVDEKGNRLEREFEILEK